MINVTVESAYRQNRQPLNITEGDDFDKVAWAVGVIMKPSVWGTTHILVNGREIERRKYGNPRDGDDILFVYEDYSILERQKDKEGTERKYQTLVSHLKRHLDENEEDVEELARKILSW